MDTRGAERLPFLCYPGRRATQRFSARCEPVSDLPLFGSLPANSQTLPRATAWPCTSMGGSGAQVKNVLGSTSTSERGLLSYPQISWHRIHAPSLCCPGEVMRPTRRNEYSWGTLEGQTSGDRYTTNASGKFGAAADCLNDFQLERTTQTACVHEAGHLCNDSFIVLQPDCTAIARRVVETTAGGKFRPVGPGAHRITAILILLLPACQATQGQDWPQFLGPGRDGVYAGQLPAAWPKPGIEVLWKVDVGQGFSAPVVARGRVILFHRRDKQAIVEALDEDTGKRIWSAAYPTDYRDDFGFDEGPRAAPAVAGERIFTFGAEGVLQALDFSTGKRLWSVDTRQKFDAPKGFFGAVCSPLVDDGRVLLNIGGPNGAGIGRSTQPPARYSGRPPTTRPATPRPWWPPSAEPATRCFGRGPVWWTSILQPGKSGSSFPGARAATLRLTRRRLWWSATWCFFPPVMVPAQQCYKSMARR